MIYQTGPNSGSTTHTPHPLQANPLSTSHQAVSLVTGYLVVTGHGVFSGLMENGNGPLSLWRGVVRGGRHTAEKQQHLFLPFFPLIPSCMSACLQAPLYPYPALVRHAHTPTCQKASQPLGGLPRSLPRLAASSKRGKLPTVTCSPPNRGPSVLSYSTPPIPAPGIKQKKKKPWRGANKWGIKK